MALTAAYVNLRSCCLAFYGTALRTDSKLAKYQQQINLGVWLRPRLQENAEVTSSAKNYLVAFRMHIKQFKTP